jgi:universal stress protein A
MKQIPTMHLANILVPVDFSAESKNAVRYANAFAREFGASLTLFHAVEPVVSAADFGYGPVTRRTPNQKLVKRAKARLIRLGKTMASGHTKPSALVRTGIAQAEIVASARHLKSDLIVMGTHGECGVGQAATGSTAGWVVRHATCPVLVVRKKEHEFVWCRKS